MCVCVFSRCRAGQEKDSLRRQLQDLHKEYSNLVRAMRVTCRHLGVATGHCTGCVDTSSS